MAPNRPFSEIRPRRAGVEVRLTRYFHSKGVGVEAAAALAGSSRLHRHARQSGTLDRNAIEIVVSGVASEGGRLWGPERWLGDIDLFREFSTVVRLWVDFLCTTRTIRIPRDVLRSWAMRDLSVQRMLNQSLVHQLRIHDMVYGLDARPTASRLAQLIHYLAHQAPDLEEARLLPFAEGRLHGPTQKHLADALGVSLASIEKSMSHLRTIGALASSGKGRANRAYTILDADLLHLVATGTEPTAT
ncbi:hypothetical protein OG599_06145 [Streptomyces sp. NBC_01335]|uniref:Crp/Fnr family transcriptional regulator n=1 Tax=Streptomyces sp. NBC_01335 TaxID=2903828 RepID=UPI002E0E16EB|nr:hypothetical protein OG599_06145 [Streptomyces sp. NBC_01335]